MSELDSVGKVVETYRKMQSEISKDASEYDVRHRIIKYLVEGLLGYQGKDYQAEKDKTDIKLLDETHSLVLVVIETKKPTVYVDDEKWKKQAFGYADAFTKYVVLTNGLQLRIWNRIKKAKPFINLDFEAILSEKRLISEKLTMTEKSQISSLWELSKENLWSEKKYQDFYVAEKIDIAMADGFGKLLEKLDFIMNRLLWGFTLKAFSDCVASYDKFQAELGSLYAEAAKTKDKELKAGYERQKRELEDRNQRYNGFWRGYQYWLRVSGREDNQESREVFCKETIYVLLNKILLVRICEDKGLVAKKISNSGIQIWRQFASHLKESYKDLLDIAYRDAAQLYGHVYERTLFDWESEGNDELNSVLNRVLFVFNHFDFKKVNRDILGRLYEKYLPKEERKRLGEFYTPDEVINYILDYVGYVPDAEIEGKDLLDPACGSGGFLVRAMNRLIERYKAKGLGPKEILTNVINHVYGFDINPFACHITEMNLLFQVIDLYQEAKDKDEAFQLPRFNVYQTDSLEAPSSTLYKWQYTNSKIQKYVEEKEIVDKIKSKEFDFVLGNPPYVSLSMTIRRLFKENKLELAEHYKALISVYRKLFKTPFKNFDLYMLFLEKGLDWLSENGKLGFICSDQFMMTFYGRKLRSYLLENSTIKHIVDFGDSGVFQDVTNYPCILVLEKRDKTKTNQIQCVKVYKPTDNILSAVESVVSKGPYKSDYFSVFAIQQKKLSAQVWTLAPSNEVDVIDKMREKASQTLGELCDFDSGIRTGKDPLFVVRLIKETEGPNCTVLPYGYRKEKKTFTVEKDLLRPVLRGRNVRRWRTTWDNLFVLFPHKEVGESSVSIPEDELKEKYPNTYKYLETHKSQLKSRSHYGKTPEELHGTWYALMHPAKYLREKILSPQLTNQTNFAIDREGYRFLGGPGGLMGIVPKNSASSLLLLGLLNSKLYDFYLKHSTQIKAGKYYQFGISHLTNFPISTFNNEKELTGEISRLTGQIIDSYENLAKCKIIKSDFARLLNGIETVKLDDFPSLVFNLKMKKLGDIRRDENTVYLNLVDTISCKDEIVARYVELALNGSKDKLEKAVDLVSEIYHLQIPRNIADIEKVVNSYSSTLKEGGNLLQEIAKLEREIDQKVYRLFGLSHSEIALIEKS